MKLTWLQRYAARELFCQLLQLKSDLFCCKPKLNGHIKRQLLFDTIVWATNIKAVEILAIAHNHVNEIFLKIHEFPLNLKSDRKCETKSYFCIEN